MREDITFVSPYNGTKPFTVNIAGTSYCDGSYHIVRRNSAIFCMEYIIEGCGTVRYMGREYHPEKGDVYMLLYGKDHDYFSDAANPWTKIWFNAAGPLIENLVRAYGFEDAAHFTATGLAAEFERMIALCKSGAGEDEINAKCALAFHEILAKLYEKRRFETAQRSPEALAMKTYIDAHLNQNVSAETLAALIYKSRSQAIRIFKNEFHTTPYEYLLDCRFNKAKSYLRSTNLLVKEIAYLTGFSDEHYFSDFFKRKCGTSPKEYRNADAQLHRN